MSLSFYYGCPTTLVKSPQACSESELQSKEKHLCRSTGGITFLLPTEITELKEKRQTKPSYFLKETAKEEYKLLSMLKENKTRHYKHKLLQERFILDITERNINCLMVGYYNRLSWDCGIIINAWI